MLNLTNVARAPMLNFEVHLARKQTENDFQNARRRVEHVKARDQYEARDIALAMPQNKAFRVINTKEIRL